MKRKNWKKLKYISIALTVVIITTISLVSYSNSVKAAVLKKDALQVEKRKKNCIACKAPSSRKALLQASRP